MSLTKSQIRSTRKREWLPIPQWTPEGESHDPAKHGVHVAQFGTRAALDFESELVTRLDEQGNAKPEHQAELLALLAIFGCQDADGAGMFDKADMAWLVNEPWEVLTAISEVVSRLNGMNEKAAAERLGNSDAGLGCNSPSDSPAISA